VALGATNRLHLLARCYSYTDKTWHGYLPYYAEHLGPLRFHRNVVLEIGVGGRDGFDQPAPGGSLRVWRDYFPRSVIAGLDINEKNVQLGERVRFFRGDQSSTADLTRVAGELGRLDVVIDDGSHVGAHQWASFRVLFPLLRPGGWYVIEDLSTSYYPDYEGGVPAPSTTGVGLLRELVDSVQVNDPTFDVHPEWGARPPVDFSEVQAMHVYPGIAFIQKRG